MPAARPAEHRPQREPIAYGTLSAAGGLWSLLSCSEHAVQSSAGLCAIIEGLRLLYRGPLVRVRPSAARGLPHATPHGLGVDKLPDLQAAMVLERHADDFVSLRNPRDREVHQRVAPALEGLDLVCLRAVEGHGAATHVQHHGLRLVQGIHVGRSAGAGVIRPVPQAPALEVAQGTDDAEASVVLVAVALRRVVLVDTNRREGEVLSLLEPRRRVIIHVLAQQLRDHRVLRALPRDHQLAVGADGDQAQHLRVHEGLAVGDHVQALLVLPELPGVQDEGHVGVADPPARPRGLRERPLGPPLGQLAAGHPVQELEGVPLGRRVSGRRRLWLS
mmetsp:Transcript_92507/g.270780  ORF Transcript_92507/g.270780 Transcript_92507/m.270780 type:complete len:332 (-) Transcript_92507:1102-2097(-)